MSNAIAPKTIPYARLISSHSRVTKAVLTHQYHGKGTKNEPYIVTWVPSDPGNPMEFSNLKKWAFSAIAAVAMLSTVFDSSAFTGESCRIC
jgi:hypothetical protein